MLNEELIQRAEKLNAILRERGSKFIIKFEENYKNNVVKPGYVLVSELHNCSPVVYLNEELLDMENQELVNYFEEFFEKASLDINISAFYNKEYILGNILPRLVSATNQDGLQRKKIAHIPFLDMMIIFYVPINSVSLIHNSASFQVTDDCLERMGISKDEAYAWAYKNLERTIDIASMQEIFGEMPFLDEELIGERKKMWVISNETKVYGASVILSNLLMIKLKKEFGEKFVILPSSIHECIVVEYKEGMDLHEALEMVCDVNSNMVALEDKLTDNVYIFEDNTLKAVF